ncbi:hypothetical protein AB205_0149670 [Aquarana catesbeiana]|uniref:Uncharacterized protein n=1 Tax=Aquarana catesbeiana TaxID=8400 RepID=A0A2G9SL70_AQUCT|nr:hypothetical protein AB205_0149670 [Aquarana catesbeiana]
MHETPPIPDILSIYSLPLVFQCSGRAHGGETTGACSREQQRLKPRATNVPIPEEI